MAVEGPGLPAGFLGTLRQVCVVTRDHRRTIDGMLRAGIGPWQCFTFGPQTCTDLTYRGSPAAFTIRVCLADVPGMSWEVIEPLEGPNIFADFLEASGEGIQHFIFDCAGRPWAEKRAALEAAGYECLQSARWLGRATFAYYGPAFAANSLIEIVDLPDGWRRPKPDEVIAWHA